jgi:hypothetical protein
MTQQTATKEETKNGEGKPAEVKKKRTFWEGFMNFLMMGGFILVLIAGVAIAIGISILFKCK